MSLFELARFACINVAASAVGAMIAYVSFFPLIRLHKRYRPKRIVLYHWEPFVALGLVALTVPVAWYFEDSELLHPIGPQQTMFALAILVCWFMALRILNRFVVRAPVPRFLFQAIVMPGMIATAMLATGLTLDFALRSFHFSPYIREAPRDWLWGIPPAAAILGYLLTLFVAQSVAPPDHPE